MPAFSSDGRYHLVVISLLAPILYSFLVCSAVKHERVHRSWYASFGLAGAFCDTSFISSVDESLHILHRDVIVLGHHTERFCDVILLLAALRWLLLSSWRM